MRLGCFYEDEIWDSRFSTLEFTDSLIRVHRQLVRLNTSLKYAAKIGERADLALVNYVQFPFNSFFGQPRWFLDANLNLSFNQKWSTVFNYEHIYDVYRPLPIDEYYYALTIGLRLQL